MQDLKAQSLLRILSVLRRSRHNAFPNPTLNRLMYLKKKNIYTDWQYNWVHYICLENEKVNAINIYVQDSNRRDG